MELIIGLFGGVFGKKKSHFALIDPGATTGLGMGAGEIRVHTYMFIAQNIRTPLKTVPF